MSGQIRVENLSAREPARESDRDLGQLRPGSNPAWVPRGQIVHWPRVAERLVRARSNWRDVSGPVQPPTVPRSHRAFNAHEPPEAFGLPEVSTWQPIGEKRYGLLDLG